MAASPRHNGNNGEEMNSPKDPQGWEAVAVQFICARSPTIGKATVSQWLAHLPAGGSVLDLGCGFGEPHARQLLAAGHEVFGIDASPTLAAECRRRLPNMSVTCEPIEDSDFFGRRFDAVLAIGLIFLLDEPVQERVLAKSAAALTSGGRLLFTAPWQPCEWQDRLTGRRSSSLGRQRYSELLERCGLSLEEELTDEGDNHYFHFVRPA